ncbi:MAG TPA: LLM class flavin-dependent oxidoreductase [Dehalococcoidia bacterium]|nr:LLM class flavin-dependent oxidoreductase [Dehalococcoidia bacterium]
MSLPFQNPDGSAPSIAQVMARARLIEDIGFDGIWFGETIGRTATARPDPLVWLSMAAAGTQRVELGTAILQTPLRYPVEFAQRLMTLHALSGGRFRAGLGAGSTKADFDAVGVDFDGRFREFSQGLKTIRALLNGEQVGEANLQPWPNAVGGPPIYLGAWESGLWVKRAARDYDGWLASGRTTFKALREGIKRFRDAGGKRALVATVSIDLSKPEAALNQDENFSLACGPKSAKERLHLLEEMGYDDVLLVRMNHTEADITEADLRSYRALTS